MIRHDFHALKTGERLHQRSYLLEMILAVVETGNQRKTQNYPCAIRVKHRQIRKDPTIRNARMLDVLFVVHIFQVVKEQVHVIEDSLELREIREAARLDTTMKILFRCGLEK